MEVEYSYPIEGFCNESSVPICWVSFDMDKSGSSSRPFSGTLALVFSSALSSTILGISLGMILAVCYIRSRRLCPHTYPNQPDSATTPDNRSDTVQLRAGSYAAPMSFSDTTRNGPRAQPGFGVLRI